MKIEEYYSALGKLLYAVALIDGKVQKKEYHMLRSSVMAELKELDDTVDEFNTDHALITEFQFDFLEDQIPEVDQLIQDFYDYLNENPDIPESYRQATINSAERIADSFAGINRPESAFLKELKKKLIPPKK